MTSLPRLSQSPTEPRFVQNPYPFYAQARAAGPLIWWETYQMACTTNFAATNLILRDRRFGREPIDPPPPPVHLAPFQAVEAHSLLELEPPKHTRLRGLVMRAFTSRRIASLDAEIEALCHHLIDQFPNQPHDIIKAYATPIPVIIIARLLGVPETMADDLLRWSNTMVAMYQARRSRQIEEKAAKAAQDFAAFLTTYIAERRNDPRDDLITELIAAEQDGERLSTDEMISTCILLLNAGHEATVHTLGNGIKALATLDDPAQFTTPERIKSCVEEVLRFDPPLHIFTRFVYEDLDLFGHRFTRGDEVACLLAAASHDPEVNADPATFDPMRVTPQHLSLGAGLHFCVGAPLARLELQIALRVLFQRCPRLRVVDPTTYADLYHFHGLERLMVQS